MFMISFTLCNICKPQELFATLFYIHICLYLFVMKKHLQTYKDPANRFWHPKAALLQRVSFNLITKATCSSRACRTVEVESVHVSDILSSRHMVLRFL